MQAYHGPGKGWKDEPTVKSSLYDFNFLKDSYQYFTGGTMFLPL